MMIDKSQPNSKDFNVLEDFITGASDILPSPKLLKQTRLEPYAYTKQVQGDNYKKAYVQAHTRHQLISNEVYSLVKACLENNIEVILFKGFYLAEFVYQSPAARFYGDVDVLIDPVNLDAFIEIAKTLDWDYEYRFFETHGINHNIANLQSQNLGTRLDIHRFPFATALTHRKKQRDITQSIWNNSKKATWQNISITIMQPIDILLSGLILNRFWGDGLLHKPHDYVDFLELLKKYAISESDLKSRAKELKVVKTLELYQKTCNPYNSNFVLESKLKRPNLIDSYNLIIERGPIRITSWIARLPKLPRLVIDSILALPHLLHITYLFKRHKNLDSILKKIIHSSQIINTNTQKPSIKSHKRIVRVCQWLTTVLMPRTEGRCLVRSLLMFKLLRRQGFTPVFLAGVRRNNGNLESHAWVELNGRCLDGTGDNLVRHTYTINVSSENF